MCFIKKFSFLINFFFKHILCDWQVICAGSTVVVVGDRDLHRTGERCIIVLYRNKKVSVVVRHRVPLISGLVRTVDDAIRLVAGQQQ